jgi:ABC-type polysaccharide/polyol phosphate export permease
MTFILYIINKSYKLPQTLRKINLSLLMKLVLLLFSFNFLEILCFYYFIQKEKIYFVLFQFCFILSPIIFEKRLFFFQI